MTKKNITRKEFLSKTGKCAGGLICTPMVLSIFQSCGVNEPNADCIYTSTCQHHGSVFNEEGDVLSGPASNSLIRYDASLSENKTKIIFNTAQQIISTCPCHGAQFNEDGDVLSGPALNSLTRYDASLSEESILITGSNETILLSDHPNLEIVGGSSSLDSIDIDSKGVLIYRKSVSEVVILSRECTHNGCQIGAFQNIEIDLNDHPDLQTPGGVSAIETSSVNPKGLLLYRKSEDEIIVLSRACPHQGTQTDPFQEC